ncbi:hypothetical protein D9757_000156 [Collybiopsis confluens]|uniref:Integral membrane protein n=1 Tax=Collybiopsis confluens TaxID=2823264 RepID=A0A8H5I241_9AGAR|nr:hypothetical protein D9757_000156 [Collybiopsis confluens]
MRYSWCSLAFPILLLLLLPSSPALAGDSRLSRSAASQPRDGDHHMHMSHNAAPLLQLNETEITVYHAPTPESYYTLDIDNLEHSSQRHPGLMFLHATLMTLAFFVALPVGIAMRSVNHAWHKLATVAFYVFIILGLASNGLYRKLTPNMYEGQQHARQGFLDHRHPGQRGTSSLNSAEYAGLVSEEPDDMQMVSPISPPPHKRVHYDDAELNDTAQWANNVRSHRRDYSHSVASETTIFGRSHSDDDLDCHPIQKVPLAQRIGTGIFVTLERILVFGGLAQVLTGIVVYTGGCRENYLNGCLAHLIKGAIFWSYGLVSFARYLGAFAELGWAWNRAPSVGYPSAEFIESFVIFLYGITNTWMERFGAHAGDAFTTKQIQHIGIAVMFWFAGLVGMAIESKTVRKWLASSTISALSPSQQNQEVVAEPPTYIASFNPFPALVIGVTGAAMAAHAQTYLFQVQIHQLWGNLLVAWSVLRCLTYFFLWLGPPRSMLPSRPPTEALGSFFLACGGLSFMFSTEELTIAAMRRGRDDVMMFLNVAVAITCLCFSWTIAVVGFKGYLKSRIAPRVAYHSSA